MATKAAAKKVTAKKIAVKKTASKGAAKKSATPASKKWSAKVDTDSTHPDQGLFLKSAPKIAEALATKRVSPGGPGSGMQMLNFYINRAGKNLPKSRVATLEHAKKLLSGIIADTKGSPAAKKTSKKTPAKAASPKR